jgi:hypothetical protein
MMHKQEAGVEVEPMGDLNTEAEKKLGKLVSDKLVLFVLSVYVTINSIFANTDTVCCKQI